MLKTLITLLSLTLTMQTQAFITVGGDGSCDYTTIQSAIDSGASDEIRIASNKTYSENITILQSKKLIGGYTNCFQANSNITDLSQANITAANSNAHTLLLQPTTGENSVLLRNLKISNGYAGIYTSPVGKAVLETTLDNLWIDSNSNRGVYITNTDDGQSDVYIINSQISSNEAGGILCQGSNNLLIIAGQSLISNNTAPLGGGGIVTTNGCSVGVYSPTQIIDNEAVYGGAIASLNSGVYLYGLQVGEYNGIPVGELESPVMLSGNKATKGGAIYADNTGIFGYNVLIEDNQASDAGGAIYAQAGGFALFQSSLSQTPQECWSPGACVQIKGNMASNGGAIAVTDGSSIGIEGALITENRASTGVVAKAYDGGAFGMYNSIIHSNGQNGEGAYSDDQLFVNQSGNNQISSSFLSYVTVADNRVTQQLIENTDGSIEVYSSIILDESVDVYQQAGQQSQLQTECLMVREDGSFSAGPTVSVTNDNLETIFVNPAAGDYHLTAGSPAIDYCYDTESIPWDIDGEIRGVDTPGMVNLNGPYDIGADETDSINVFDDLIFADGF